MSTLAEIETAIPQLALDELSDLERFVRDLRLKRSRTARPSAFDLPVLRLGRMLKPLDGEDDLMEEMLNDPRY